MFNSPKGHFYQHEYMGEQLLMQEEKEPILNENVRLQNFANMLKQYCGIFFINIREHRRKVRCSFGKLYFRLIFYN